MSDQEPPHVPVHPSGLNQNIVAKVFAKRGYLHAYETIIPSKTALVVTDMMRCSVEADDNCLRIIDPINNVASVVRANGGIVAWVTSIWTERARANVTAVYGVERAGDFQSTLQPENAQSSLWEGLHYASTDLLVAKSGASAFFPNNCQLHDLLRERGIDTVLIAGTVTNVCCESSARDAAELGYRVIMISDANAGHAHGLHEASLNTIYRCFCCQLA